MTDPNPNLVAANAEGERPSASPVAGDTPVSSQASNSSSDSSNASAPSTAVDSKASPTDAAAHKSPSSASSNATKRPPSLRNAPQTSSMHPSSTPVGVLNQARGPPVASQLGLLAKARAFQQARMGLKTAASSGAIPGAAGTSQPGAFLGTPAMVRPSVGNPMASDSAVPMIKAGGLAGRRGLKLANMGGNPMGGNARGPMTMELPGMQDAKQPMLNKAGQGTRISDFDKYIDAEKGWITFDGAATIKKEGVEFANGANFKISLDDVIVLDELGKGNYGTVYKVRHAKPAMPRFGQGLSGFRKQQAEAEQYALGGDVTGKVMAMKEIRLELDEAKFGTILKELVILHQCRSPFIIDFYGAFFQEGSVYMCIEFMDGGSIDQLYDGGVPENVLRKIIYATVSGLKYLKEQHNIIHRDVKPTNILVSTNGKIKICDFGVSGNLVASMAKTNIGCQSYMAPERITQGSGSMATMDSNAASTYSVSSDVWSLGLSMIECATGKYPYPPEISNSILGQLNAIVEGEPPSLPDDYSAVAKDFVNSCLHKLPSKRASYAALLQHPWIAQFSKPHTIKEEDEDAVEDQPPVAELATGVEKMQLATGSVEAGDADVAEWVQGAIERKKAQSQDSRLRPALHTVALENMKPSAPP